MTDINRIKKFALLIILPLVGCIYGFNNRTIKVALNHHKDGWYFIRIIQDSTMQDTGTVNLRFDDTTHFLSVRINHIENTIISPCDYEGNSLSSRLRELGEMHTGEGIFFEFYNPTEGQVSNPPVIGSNEDHKISHREDLDFKRYYKYQGKN